MNSLTHFKKILILPLLIALALVAVASPTVARADAVTDWNLIAANTAELRERPRAVGRQRTAVHRPERGDAPHRWAERAHQCRIRGGLQRSQGARLAHKHDPNTGSDRCCDLLAGPSDGALEPSL